MTETKAEEAVENESAENGETKTRKPAPIRFDPFENPGPLAEEEAAWLNEKFPGLDIQPGHVRAVISHHSEFQKSPSRQANRAAEHEAVAKDREERKQRHADRMATAEERRKEREAAAVKRQQDAAEKAAAKAQAAKEKAEKKAAEAAEKAAAAEAETEADRPSAPVKKAAPKKRVSRTRSSDAASADDEF